MTELGPHFSFILHEEEEEATSKEDETVEEDITRNLLPLELSYEDPIFREIRIIKSRETEAKGKRITRKRLDKKRSELADIAALVATTSAGNLLARNRSSDLERPPSRSSSNASSRMDSSSADPEESV